jgi:hypothetical protein
MTPRPVTDDQLAAALRAHVPAADPALRRRIFARIIMTPQERPRPWMLSALTASDPMVRRRMMLLVGVVALAASVAVAAMAGALLRHQPTPDLSVDRPRVLPTLTGPSSTPDQSVDPHGVLPTFVIPSPAPDDVVHGWPDTSENSAGLYSWNGRTCSTESCVMGFMHNGYGSGDVRILIDQAFRAPVLNDDAVAVRLAELDAIYQRTGTGEHWFVDIDGTMIAIRLEAAAGTSESDLADAHAIIESMRVERRKTALGFRLVFRLTTDDWDSG